MSNEDSNKRRQYNKVNNLNKRIRRSVQRCLEEDVSLWSGEGGSDSHNLAVENNEPQDHDSLDPIELHETGHDNEGNESQELDCSPGNFSSHLLDMSFLEHGHESDEPTFTISLNFDCDVCINCKCAICEECVHTDGVSCKHCRYCRMLGDVEDLDESGSSDSDSDFETFDVDPSESLSESQKKDEEIKSDFINIVLKHNATHMLVSDLLAFFQKHNFGNFHRCAKTLLKTPQATKLRAVPPGHYWHRGITADILEHVEKTGCDLVEVDVSTDGVPGFDSSLSEFYPLCCSLNGSDEVLLAGVYFGHGKPASFNDLFKDLVEELKELENGFEWQGRQISVQIRFGIFDAVARASALYIKAHSGFYGCPKCTVKGGKVENRMCFLDWTCPLRTDQSFREQWQEEHHKGESILCELKTFKPVSNVPLDYMHLVLLGIFRTMVYLMLAGPTRVRQSGACFAEISENLVNFAAWVPSDFVRKCRSLQFVKKFKAVEWRLLLFYVGVVAFASALPKHLYEHFLILHVIMTIISCEEHLESHSTYAQELASCFTQAFMKLYGKTFVNFNLHNLTHLIEDCKIHGVVDKFSAFKYENFYGLLQKMVRKGDKPLQQISRRYSELKMKKNQSQVKHSRSQYSGLHNDGPLPPWCINPQFSSFSEPGKCKLTTSKPNNCCCLVDGSVIVVENFASLRSNKSKVVVGRKFLQELPLYEVPCNSTIFGIKFVSKLSALQTWPVESIKKKCFRVPLKTGFAVFPLLHAGFTN